MARSSSKASGIHESKIALQIFNRSPENVSALQDDTHWDLCVVLSTEGSTTKMVKEKDASGRKFEVSQSEHFVRRADKLMKRIHQAGLRTCLHKSTCGNVAFLLIGASEERLKLQAEYLEFELPFDGEMCLNAGLSLNMMLARATMEFQQSFPRGIWEGMYGTFLRNSAEVPDREKLYKTYSHPGSQSTTLFRNIDRINLIDSTMILDDDLGGVGFKPSKYIADPDEPVLAYFPLHDREQLKRVQQDISRWKVMWQFPLNSIRGYYGENIALYFAFLQFHTRMMLIPAVPGLILFVYEFLKLGPNYEFLALAYGIFVSLWSAFYIKMWSRRQNTLKQRWGMTKFEEREISRPTFKGKIVASPVDGRALEVVSPVTSAVKKFIAHGFSVAFIVLCIYCNLRVIDWRVKVIDQKEEFFAGPASSISVLINFCVCVLRHFAYSYNAVSSSS